MWHVTNKEITHQAGPNGLKKSLAILVYSTPSVTGAVNYLHDLSDQFLTNGGQMIWTLSRQLYHAGVSHRKGLFCGIVPPHTSGPGWVLLFASTGITHRTLAHKTSEHDLSVEAVRVLTTQRNALISKESGFIRNCRGSSRSSGPKISAKCGRARHGPRCLGEETRQEALLPWFSLPTHQSKAF